MSKPALVLALAAALAACSSTPSGPCQDACAEGQSQCVSGGIATCAPQPSGCLGFSAPTACATGFVCSGGACSLTCSDQCQTGETRCAGAEVEVCATQPSGCTDWSAPSACAANAACTGSACPGCTDSCTAGPATCASDTSTTSCQIGASGCLEPVTTPCNGSDICQSGQCVAAPVCSSCPSGYTCGNGGVCGGGNSTQLELNVQTFTVSGAVSLNNALPMTGQGCVNYPDGAAANVSFHETTHGYNISAAIPCNTSDFSYSATLFPGTWQVTVSNGYASNSSNFPDVNYVVNNGLVVNGNLTGQDFNVQTVTVSGLVTLNNALPMTGQGCTNYPDGAAANVTFHETTHGYTITAAIPCNTTDFSYSATLFPGSYQVTVSNGYASNSSNFPDVNYVTDNALVVNGNLTGQNFNVQTVTVSGVVTLNNAMPMTGQGCTNYPEGAAANVSFHETAHGYSITAAIPCNTVDFAYSATLFPGTWQVTVSNGYASNSSNFPDVNYVVNDGLVVNGNLTGQNFNVQTVTVSGLVTLNNAMPMAGQGCTNYPDGAAANVSFHETTHGYNITAAIPCNTVDFAYLATLFPGTWQVTVSNGYASNSSNFPDVNYVVNNALVVNGNLTGQDFNVQTVTVTGLVTLNNALPMTGQGCTNYPDGAAANVSFHETTHGYNITAAIPCNTVDFAYSATLFPGTWQVTVSNGYASNSSNFPDVNYVVNDGLVVNGSLSNQDFNVQTVTVSGVVTLNNALPTTGQGCVNYPDGAAANVGFHETTHGYNITAAIPCNTADFSFSATIFPGTWQITVSNGYASNSSNLPDANYVVVAAIALP